MIPSRVKQKLKWMKRKLCLFKKSRIHIASESYLCREQQWNIDIRQCYDCFNDNQFIFLQSLLHFFIYFISCLSSARQRKITSPRGAGVKFPSRGAKFARRQTGFWLRLSLVSKSSGGRNFRSIVRTRDRSKRKFANSLLDHSGCISTNSTECRTIKD